MKIHMSGIVSTDNKRLADSGFGGWGVGVRVQTGSMKKFSIIFIPLD